ncbi:MAG: DNA mismatch repair protein MutS [Treponema sp.]|jgi:DNA mismatch repair protein MutS|nr:DNA mismatch repair protein MutS [Treponema sp.]
MLDQYRRIKRENQGNVLFFRLGDFYEMFAEDALEVSALLNLTLTSRNGLPMCGVPYHAVRSYIARLLKFGKKIAICEQLSEPTKGRGVIERKVVEVITPGTTVDEDFLDKGSSNYLAALASTAKFISLAYIDLSAGDFHATSFPFEGAAERLRLELERLQIKEMVVQESLLEEKPMLADAIMERPAMVVNRWADWLFDRQRSRKRLEKQFGAHALRAFGIQDDSPEIIASGALLDYLDDTAQSLIPHVRILSLYGDTEYVGMDESSMRNLELVHNLRDGDIRFSLLEVMDETHTSMGRRLLKRRLLHPLRDIDRINKRLDMVEILYRDQGCLTFIRDILSKTPDLERLCSRLAMDRAHGKDMVSVKNSLSSFEYLEETIRELSMVFEASAGTSSAPEEKSADPTETFTRLISLRDLLDKSLAEEPSILLTEGNLIRDGFNKKLDKYKRLKDNGRQLLGDYLEEERQATGIPSLKIRYNRLIGYFFEVTNNHLAKVPAHFIRRQGIVSGERFTTDRLAALESDINGASDKITELEKELFLEIREQAKARIPEISIAAQRIAELDVAQALARSATMRGWVRPRVDNRTYTRIEEGRHPVVEAHLPPGEFIPNSVVLNGEEIYFVLITGPNMAGKSTYLRQTALITIMAQMGSFVPAREADIGLVDRIYCRVGASDNLARGESTFLTEMNETAYILRTATDQSLVIMDEVGRGTGTNDGLSIAWAVSEELLDHIKCRTLFATHYHELSELTHQRMANRSMEVLEKDGELVFLRKLKEGPSTESYGLHVAQLAGLPPRVISRAGRILERLLERGRTLGESPGSIQKTLEAEPSEAASSREAGSSGDVPQPVQEKPVDERYERFKEDLTALNPDRMSPMEALNRIYIWKQFFTGKTAPPRSSRASRQRQGEPSLFDLRLDS